MPSAKFQSVLYKQYRSVITMSNPCQAATLTPTPVSTLVVVKELVFIRRVRVRAETRRKPYNTAAVIQTAGLTQNWSPGKMSSNAATQRFLERLMFNHR